MKHISYSELKTWAECAWKHKLIYIDKVNKFVGNEYTAFGRALHLLCEHAIEDKIQEEDYDDFWDIAFDHKRFLSDKCLALILNNPLSSGQ